MTRALESGCLYLMAFYRPIFWIGERSDTAWEVVQRYLLLWGVDTYD